MRQKKFLRKWKRRSRDKLTSSTISVKVNRKTILIEWGDCDPAGIVYFPRYLAFFDNCTSALFSSVGLPKYEPLKRYEIVGIPLVDVRASFAIPSRFGDEVVVESSIEKWGRSSFHVHHRLMKDDALAVEGFETRVWAARAADDPEKIKGQPVPQEVIDRFS
jgi:4-hydroxybenzoyl-CoA thioesterase